MAKSTLGNNTQPVCFLTEYEVEVDEDEYENMNGELVDEEDIIGYRCTCPKNSDSTIVTIYFYYYAPTSEWYWDYNYGMSYKPVIPVVFACDSNWNLTTCLNQSFSEIDLSNRSSGWISMNVTLNRKLVKNEKIIFGVYSDILGVASSRNEWNGPGETNCYNYYSQARRRNYNSATAYVSSSEFIQKAESVYSDWEVCLYLEYVNEIESVAYTRTVLGNVRAATSNSRKLKWKRTMRSAGNVASSLNRKSVLKRNTSSSGSLASVSQRHNHLKRRSSSAFSVKTVNNSRIFFFRLLENISNIVSGSNRYCRMKIKKTDEVLSADNLNRHVFLRKSFSSGLEASALCGRKNILRRKSSAGISFTDRDSKRLNYARLLETRGKIKSKNFRALDMRIEKADRFSFADGLSSFLRIIRSCFAYGSLFENQNHKAAYKRLPESVVDNEESIVRWGDSFRSAADEFEVSALPFASRLFFRTVQTVMGLWDWLRGKIREANNVVTFFCPIHLEIEMECRI